MLAIPARSELERRPLESKRLLLTPVGPSDGPDLFRAVEASREALRRWLPWVEYTTDVALSNRFAEACAADWDHGRAVRFAIRERGTGAFLGIVGLENCIHLHKACELGYWLRSDATRKGFMTEAVGQCLHFAFRYMGVHRLRVAAATDNHSSLRVIGRCGFHFEGIARQAEWCDQRWLDHAVFSLLSVDYRS